MLEAIYIYIYVRACVCVCVYVCIKMTLSREYIVISKNF